MLGEDPDDLLLIISVKRPRAKQASRRVDDMERTLDEVERNPRSLLRMLEKAALKRRAYRLGRRVVRNVGRALSRGADVEASAAEARAVTQGMRAARTSSRAGLYGAIAAIAVTTLVVAERVVSDQPFEGTGEEVNRYLLGEFDDEARANMDVRAQLEGNPLVLRAVGGAGAEENPQVKSIAALLKVPALRRQRGMSMLREQFPVNGMYDFLALKLYDFFKRAFDVGGFMVPPLTGFAAIVKQYRLAKGLIDRFFR